MIFKLSFKHIKFHYYNLITCLEILFIFLFSNKFIFLLNVILKLRVSVKSLARLLRSQFRLCWSFIFVLYLPLLLLNELCSTKTNVKNSNLACASKHFQKGFGRVDFFRLPVLSLGGRNLERIQLYCENGTSFCD